MSEEPRPRPGANGYRALGLIGNPFLRPDEARPDAIGQLLAAHAEALGLLRAVDAAADEERARPIMVMKAADAPTFYHRSAMTDALSMLSANDDMGAMAVYVPLESVRIGRIRATLGVIAEHLAGPTFDKTLAAYARSVFSDVDETLPEYADLAGIDLDGVRESLANDGVATVASWFGPCVAEREQDAGMLVMRVASARQGMLESEPVEPESAPEEVVEGEGSEVFLMDLTAAELEAPEEGEPEQTDEDKLASYLIAHTKTHLSPVVARGLRAYQALGTIALSQELKVTKAPKKTLKALLAFLGHRYRRVVVFYDRFESWPFMPEDLKPRIMSMLTELRWITERHGLLVLLTAPGVAPEVEEQFAAATRLDWTFESVSKVDAGGVDLSLVAEWVRCASLGDGSAVDEAVLARIAEEAADDLSRFSEIAADAIDDAARRGLDRIDDAALAAAFAGGTRTEGS